MPARRLVALSAALLAFSAAAGAGTVSVSGGWFRAMPAGLPAGGYFELANGTPDAISLTGASSPACGMIMLHQTRHMGGMAHMTEVPRIDVPAGGSFSFAPGGYHLMCMQPTAALQAGATVVVTLEFADGTRLNASFAVRSTAAQ